MIFSKAQYRFYITPVDFDEFRIMFAIRIALYVLYYTTRVYIAVYFYPFSRYILHYNNVPHCWKFILVAPTIVHNAAAYKTLFIFPRELYFCHFFF